MSNQTLMRISGSGHILMISETGFEFPSLTVYLHEKEVEPGDANIEDSNMGRSPFRLGTIPESERRKNTICRSNGITSLSWWAAARQLLQV